MATLSEWERRMANGYTERMHACGLYRALQCPDIPCPPELEGLYPTHIMDQEVIRLEICKKCVEFIGLKFTNDVGPHCPCVRGIGELELRKMSWDALIGKGYVNHGYGWIEEVV